MPNFIVQMKGLFFTFSHKTESRVEDIFKNFNKVGWIMRKSNSPLYFSRKLGFLRIVTRNWL